jgi:eukaryotic-like serine/threonine-protein kinase
VRKRAPRLRPGDKVADRVTVVGVLDDGGRDPVYVVWHHDAWCAMCCKLFLKPSQARWEARALARLAHPGIVRLLEDGSPRYLLTEFLEGPSLRRLIRSRPKGRLSAADALRVAAHLGSALAHLHGRGYLHLDVKPANVIVTRRRPVLFDLGSARRADGRKLASPQGTDAYMAPEQCRAGVPTPASDVHGLGVTLFEMLAGTRPFPKGDGAESFPQLHLEPTPLRRLLPRAPRELERVVAWCLAPDPGDRPASVADLLPVLNGLIRTGPRMWPADLDAVAGAGAAQPSLPTSFKPTMPARIRPMQARRATVAGSP